MKEDIWLISEDGNIREDNSEQKKGPKVRLYHSQLLRKNIYEALATEEKVLSRKEKCKLWENKNRAHAHAW